MSADRIVLLKIRVLDFDKQNCLMFLSNYAYQQRLWTMLYKQNLKLIKTSLDRNEDVNFTKKNYGMYWRELLGRRLTNSLAMRA